MQFWMTLWIGLLIVSFTTFLGMLLVVGAGAIGELRETLEELRADTRAAEVHPERLDESY
jgi:hypothetical protein